MGATPCGYLEEHAFEIYGENIEQLGSELVANPQLAEVLNQTVDDQIRKFDESQNGKGVPPDGGLADLIGLGNTAPTNLGET